jgi:hypothetical protein
MTDRQKHNDHHQEEQCNPSDDNISLLIEEIYEQLVCTIVFCLVRHPWNNNQFQYGVDDVWLIHSFSLKLNDTLRKAFGK